MPVSCLVCCTISRPCRCTAHALQLWVSASAVHVCVEVARCVCSLHMKPEAHEKSGGGVYLFGHTPFVEGVGSPSTERKPDWCIVSRRTSYIQDICRHTMGWRKLHLLTGSTRAQAVRDLLARKFVSAPDFPDVITIIMEPRGTPIPYGSVLLPIQNTDRRLLRCYCETKSYSQSQVRRYESLWY